MSEAQRQAPREGGREVARDGADELPYVDDRVSKIWVLLIVGVFVAIFAYGLLLGQAGLLTTAPTPTPSPTASPTASPTTSPAVSPTTSPATTSPASPSPVVSPSPAASPSP